MDRREFLELSAAAGIIAWMNAHAVFTGPGSDLHTSHSSQVPRIRALRLVTITPLIEMKKFYGETMGLPVSINNGELVVQSGESTITFIFSAEKSKRPFYHFAFNIPENKIQEAFEWQGKKTPIIHPNPDGPRNQVVHFAHWNAHSVFFLDPAGNLLEFIARHELPNASNDKFSSKDILYVSEIGLIVDDTIGSGRALQKGMGISQYRDPTDGFWPLGDETGLLLMIRKGRTWSGLPGQINQTDIFETSVTIRDPVRKSWTLNDYPYNFSTKS